MALYGHELSQTTNPYQAGLGKVVRLGKNFVGRDALQQLSEQAADRVLVGLKGSTRRAARAGYTVHPSVDGPAVGTVTSGALSPTLGYPIALAYLDADLAETGTVVSVDIRGKQRTVRSHPGPVLPPQLSIAPSTLSEGRPWQTTRFLMTAATPRNTNGC